MAEHQVSVTLESVLCGKGHVYAYIKSSYIDCPYCLQKRLNDIAVWWRKAQDANSKKDRENSALRGTITRLKKK
jgi:hypothetical protein